MERLRIKTKKERERKTLDNYDTVPPSYNMEVITFTTCGSVPPSYNTKALHRMKYLWFSHFNVVFEGSSARLPPPDRLVPPQLWPNFGGWCKIWRELFVWHQINDDRWHYLNGHQHKKKQKNKKNSQDNELLILLILIILLFINVNK